MEMCIRYVTICVVCALQGTVISATCAENTWTPFAGQKLVGQGSGASSYSITILNVNDAPRCQELCTDNIPPIMINGQPCVSYNYFTNKDCQMFMKEKDDPGVVLEADATSTYFQCGSVGPTPPPTVPLTTPTVPTTTETAAPPTTVTTAPPTTVPAAPPTTVIIDTTELTTDEQTTPDDAANTTASEVTTNTPSSTTTRKPDEGDGALDWLRTNALQAVLIGLGSLILLLFFAAICAICILSPKKREEEEHKFY